MVDRAGIEPASPACKAGGFPVFPTAHIQKHKILVNTGINTVRALPEAPNASRDQAAALHPSYVLEYGHLP